MKKINLLELLENCPSGMELHSPMFDNLYFDYVNEKNGYPIRCYLQNDSHRTSVAFNMYGEYTSDQNSKCVIFPKGRTSWDGFVPPCKFEDGDVVFYNNTIAIFKEWGDETLFRTYCVFYTTASNPTYQFETNRQLFGKSIRKETRFATEEEKQKLFDAIKANGYKWNSESKTMEIIPKFKDGDIVTWKCGGALVACIYKKRKNTTSFNHHIALYKEGLGIVVNGEIVLTDDELSFATEEEKQKLFDAIKANGYKWNSEAKTLETLIKPNFKVGDRIKHKTHISQGNVVTEIKGTHYILDDESALPFVFQDEYKLVPNKFNINTLVPFESKVLVRDKETHKWKPAIWGFYDKDSLDYQIRVVGGYIYRYCIPYDGNEHLLATTNDCSEFYKNWE